MIRKIIVFLFLFSFLTTHVAAQEKLYVFSPSTLQPLSMQERMTSVMQGINITVFSRYEDFITNTKTSPPDAIITKTVLIQDQLSNYEISLKGERNGKTEERYIFISIDKPLNIDSVNSETVIGTVDILGRGGMKSFSKRFFPVETKLKKVSKVEDLLPMLSFNIVAGIIIEDVFLDYFKSTSQLHFNVLPLVDAKPGVVALAIKKDGSAEKTLACLKRNDKVICDLFYIEQWK